MEIWKSESSPVGQTLMAVGSAAVGIILIIAVTTSNGMIDTSNGMAGLFLGVGLFLIGGYAFFAGNKKQTTIINPADRSITVESSNFFGMKRRVIAFADIADITIGRLGRVTTGVVFYFLTLKLHGGEEYALFPPGYFYEGGFDRDAAEKRREKLKEYMSR